jgi:hypothetical protein
MMEPTATRLWKRLSRDERLAAAAAFWRETPPELTGGAIGAIAAARHLRPQVARSLPQEQRAQALASILEPGESVAASLLVALHLSERRPLLAAFLDALGLPHEEGALKEEADNLPAPSAEAVRAAVQSLRERFPEPHVALYLNALWLQDPERWAALSEIETQQRA